MPMPMPMPMVGIRRRAASVLVGVHCWMARRALAAFRLTDAARAADLAIVAAERGRDRRSSVGTLLLASEIRLTQGDLALAGELAQRAHRALELDRGADHGGTPRLRLACLRQLGLVATRRGDYATAESWLLEAVDAARALERPDAVEVASGLNLLGLLYKFSGKFDAATDAYTQAQELLTKAGCPSHPFMATLLHNLAGVAFSRGDYEQGERYANDSIAMRTRLYGAGHPHVVADVAGRGSILAQQGDLDAAAADFELAIAAIEATFGTQHHEWAVSMNNLGVVEARRGNNARAETLLRKALTAKESSCGPDHVDVAYTLVNLADLLERTVRGAEARDHLERAATIVLKRVEPGHPLAVAVE